MNNSIQLYSMNTSVTPPMCPLWPTTPALGTQLMTLPVMSYDDHFKIYQDQNQLERMNDLLGTSFKSLEELYAYKGIYITKNIRIDLPDVFNGTSSVVSFVKSVKWFSPCLALDPASCINYLSAGIIADKISLMGSSKNLSFADKSQRLAFHVFNEANNMNYALGMKNCFGRNWWPCSLNVVVGGIFKLITG